MRMRGSEERRWPHCRVRDLAYIHTYKTKTLINFSTHIDFVRTHTVTTEKKPIMIVREKVKVGESQNIVSGRGDEIYIA